MAKNHVGEIPELLKYQTWVLRVSIHCEGCKKKVKKVLQSIEGVYTIMIDSQQHKVTVTGNVDANTLVKKLIKSRKHAEIWPQQKPKEKNSKNNEKEANPKSDDEDGEDGDDNDDANECKNTAGVNQSPENVTSGAAVGVSSNGVSGGKKKKKKKKKSQNSNSGGGGGGNPDNMANPTPATAPAMFPPRYYSAPEPLYGVSYSAANPISAVSYYATTPSNPMRAYTYNSGPKLYFPETEVVDTFSDEDENGCSIM